MPLNFQPKSLLICIYGIPEHRSPWARQEIWFKGVILSEKNNLGPKNFNRHFAD